MSESIAYVTVVEPVLEVTLIGTSDAAVWQSRLAEAGAAIRQPVDRVETLLSATQTRYMGVLFRELSLSVRLDESQYFLIHAFNSNRFFAFVERRMFRTPYYHGQLEVAAHQVKLGAQGRDLLEASLPVGAAASGPEDQCIEMKVWLPRSGGHRPYFYARLEGQTQRHDTSGTSLRFLSGADSHPIFRALRQAQFALQAWTVRPTARHSKSKTYR